MTTTDRPMRADARRNYEKLVATASDVISEHGVDASLDEIARRAGVGIGTLYRHFPTRDALLEAVYRDYIAAICARADELRATLPPWEALYEWLRVYIENQTSRRGLAITLKNSIDMHSTAFTTCHGLMREVGTNLLAPVQESGEVRSDVELTHILRLVHGIALAVESAPNKAEMSDLMLGVVMDGLRHRP